MFTTLRSVMLAEWIIDYLFVHPPGQGRHRWFISFYDGVCLSRPYPRLKQTNDLLCRRAWWVTFNSPDLSTLASFSFSEPWFWTLVVEGTKSWRPILTSSPTPGWASWSGANQRTKFFNCATASWTVKFPSSSSTATGTASIASWTSTGQVCSTWTRTCARLYCKKTSSIGRLTNSS